MVLTAEFAITPARQTTGDCRLNRLLLCDFLEFWAASGFSERSIPFLLFPNNKTRADAKSALVLMEQVKGIEPSSQAWEARILPMNYTCMMKFVKSN